MPELPEVEIIKVSLEKKLIGLNIADIEILNKNSFQGNQHIAKGKKITKIWRKAKVLGIEIENTYVLLIHLKMSGQLIFSGKSVFIGGHPTQDMFKTLPNKSTRVIFTLSNQSILYFNDQRKFGWIKLVDLRKLNDSKDFLNNLGPEPLSKEFSWQILKKNLLKHPNMPVKVTMLDQKVISGIGNIYASEACFLAKIDPRNKVSTLTDNQYKLLYKSIILALKTGIKYGGSSKVHFVSPEGKKGLFLNHAFVYSRDNLPCKVCSHKIEKIKLASRGTYLCPNCQKLYNSF